MPAFNDFGHRFNNFRGPAKFLVTNYIFYKCGEKWTFSAINSEKIGFYAFNKEELSYVKLSRLQIKMLIFL